MNQKEIESLLKRSQRYLRSARLLIKDEDYSSAISRAYYAMFYLAEALLLSQGLVYSSHKAVISGFGRHFVKPGIFKKEYSKMLHQAFEKRQTAEYDYLFIPSRKEAQEIMEKAEKFFDQAKVNLEELMHPLLSKQ